MPVGSWNDPTITPFNHLNSPGPGLQWDDWGLRLLVYTKSPGIFHSPWMPDVATWWTGPCSSSNGEKITNTYQYNGFLGRDWKLDSEKSIHEARKRDGWRSE